MPKPFLLAVSVAFCVLLAACGDGSTTVADNNPTTTTSAAVPDEQAALLYRDDGVGDATIGDDAETVIAGIVAVLGEPKGDDTNAECPSGADRSVFWEGLTIVFAEGKMVGYLGTDQASDLLIERAQRSLLKPGDPESQLTTLFPDVIIEETSLGTEFYTGGDGPGGYIGLIDQGIISAIGAGDICAQR